jgi:pyruvate/2-oxoglutarate dehydrogenase complex dihydrolipoamide dehydrogenase (E3) component
MKESHYDLVILGSGSTAFAAALRAQEFGKTSVMTEERTTGGTCVNRGCLPSKNLIEAAKIIHDARHPRYPGLTPAELGLDFRKLIEQKDEVIHGYRKKKYESLTGGQFTIDTEEVLGVAMVGHTAGEVIHEAAMAMRFHAKIADFIDLLHVYPTMAEALKIVAISRRKDPAKLSCCAE